MDINKLFPSASSGSENSKSESSQARKVPAPVRKQARADALVTHVRPDLSPDAATDAAQALAGNLANRSEQALDAFGGVDEERLQALLEE